MKTWKCGLGKNKGIKKRKINKSFWLYTWRKRRLLEWRMGFILFSIDSDDLSVTISMGENCQEPEAKCSSGGNLGIKQWVCTQRLKMKHWTVRFSKRVPRGMKSGLQAIENSSSSSSHGLHPLAWSSIRSSSTKSTDLEASNAQIYNWLMKHPHSYTSSCDHNSTGDPLGSCISYIACIHLHTSVVKYLLCMVKDFWVQARLYKYSVTNIQN